MQPWTTERSPLRQTKNRQTYSDLAFWHHFVVTHRWLITGVCALVLFLVGALCKFAKHPVPFPEKLGNLKESGHETASVPESSKLTAEPAKSLRNTKESKEPKPAELLVNNAKRAEATDSGSVTMQIVQKPGAAPSTVTMKLHPEWAPIGVAQFKNLVTSHALDEAAFFRVVPGFIVQFGLPAQPQAVKDSPLQDDPVKVSNARGTVVFATSGPNTRTNQLFINLGENGPNLDAQGFSPIGEIVEGMDAVDGINSEYGEKPDQGAITSQGNAYLDKAFPNLSKIQAASISP